MNAMQKIFRHAAVSGASYAAFHGGVGALSATMMAHNTIEKTLCAGLTGAFLYATMKAMTSVLDATPALERAVAKHHRP